MKYLDKKGTLYLWNKIKKLIKNTSDSLQEHLDDKDNPHGVTLEQLGGATSESLENHIKDKSNPHGTSKEQIGLGNCDNTADADKSVKYAKNADTVDGHHFNWSGQNGQPSWLWGGNDADNMYVYNPSNFNVNSAKNINDGTYAYTPTTIYNKFEKLEKWSSTTPSNTTSIDKLQVIEYKLGHLVYVKIDFHLKTAMNYTNSIWLIQTGICAPIDGNKFFRGYVYTASNTTANASTKQTGAVVYAEGTGLSLYNYGEVLPVGDYSCDLYYFTA